MKDECQIVQDLLPLVKDDVASEASIVFVQEHCRHCEECKKLLAQENITVNSQAISKTFAYHDGGCNLFDDPFRLFFLSNTIPVS